MRDVQMRAANSHPHPSDAKPKQNHTCAPASRIKKLARHLRHASSERGGESCAASDRVPRAMRHACAWSCCVGSSPRLPLTQDVVPRRRPTTVLDLFGPSGEILQLEADVPGWSNRMGKL